MSRRSLSRRTFLRGIGTCISLPLLDAMSPRPLTAGTTDPAVAPVRMAFLYIPNGAHMPAWLPSEAGPIANLPATFGPGDDLREDLLFVHGLNLRGANSQGDGPGDHARSMAAFLTGAHPRKTDGKDIRNGISVDQWAAAKSGSDCRFPSLELGLEAGMVAGRCDSGYSCAYSSNLSWRTESTPVPKDVNPQSIFDRMFGIASQTELRLSQAVQSRRSSILDFAQEEAKALHKQLGTGDRRKLDEYLYALRDVERRVGEWANRPVTEAVSAAGIARPAGVPRDYTDYARLMLDLLVLAFQTDNTRIATFVFANEGSQRSYHEIGISEGHHTLSHHDSQASKLQQIAQINAYHASLLCGFLRRLKEIREGDGNLLANSMIVYGSGIQDGNRHNHNDLPIVLAGRGGGRIKTGRRVDCSSETPLTNLYVSLLNNVGLAVDSFGDSTGPLNELV